MEADHRDIKIPKGFATLVEAKPIGKIFWRLPTLPRVTAVPSALRGLTSLFGMGRGEHPHYNHHKDF